MIDLSGARNDWIVFGPQVRQRAVPQRPFCLDRVLPFGTLPKMATCCNVLSSFSMSSHSIETDFI